MTKKIRKKYVTKHDRPTPEQILESKMLKYSLDRIWAGLTNSEKKEVLLLSEKLDKEKMKRFDEALGL